MEREPENASVQLAVVPRQDATGLDLPAGRSAEDLAPEDYRPAFVTTGHEAAGAPRRDGPE